MAGTFVRVQPPATLTMETKVPMPAIASLIVLALAMTGCSDLRSAMPTSPTITGAESVLVVPIPTGRIVRTERWTLDLTMREVYGAGECDPGIGATRQVPLDVEFRDNDAVAMQNRERYVTHRPQGSGWVDLWRRRRGIRPGLRESPLHRYRHACGRNADPADRLFLRGRPGLRRDRDAARPLDAGRRIVYYFEWRAFR